MANRLQKLVYNVSSAAPIGIVFSIIWAAQKATYLFPMALLLFSVLIIIVFALSFSYGIKHLSPIKIRTSDISPYDNWVVVYLISYLLPLGSIVIDKVNLFIWGGISLIIALIAPFVNSSIPNPLLLFKKYHFYQVSGENGISGYVLISKRKYRKKQDLAKVNRMFDFLLIDAEKG